MAETFRLRIYFINCPEITWDPVKFSGVDPPFESMYPHIKNFGYAQNDGVVEAGGSYILKTNPFVGIVVRFQGRNNFFGGDQTMPGWWFQRYCFSPLLGEDDPI